MPTKKSYQTFILAFIALVFFALNSEQKPVKQNLNISDILDFNIDRTPDEIMQEVSTSAPSITVDDLPSSFDRYVEDVYNACNLKAQKLSYTAFKNGLVGMYNLMRTSKVHNEDILSIVDFDLPSTEKRMFVIDLKNKKLVKNLLVAHGKESGDMYATSFSNIPKSHQSSLGFYKTAETYDGKYGYSLRLDGLEKSINCKARERAIVVHGAKYVSDEFIQENSRLGRSYGCLSLKVDETSDLIDDIKSGTCIYVHKSLPSYLKASKLLDAVSSQRFFDNLFAKTI